jgi:hypothetical protein
MQPYSLLGLLFIAIGSGLMLHQLISYSMKKSWLVVSGRVIRASLSESRSARSSTTYSADIDYEYVHNGTTYAASTPRGSSDNLGSHQKELYQRMLQAQSSGSSIEVYIHPKNPKKSVISRGFRTVQFLFYAAFLVAGVACLILG